MALNPEEENNEENILEEPQLPNIIVDYDLNNPFINFNYNNPFGGEDDLDRYSYGNYCDSGLANEESDYLEEESINKQYTTDATEEKQIDINEENLSISYQKCSFCHKRTILKNMFVLKNDFSLSFICLNCSVKKTKCRDLKDWENEPNSTKTSVCPRCTKKKSYYRFRNGNKYCDYCLLKRKWARLRSKLVDSDYYEDRTTETYIDKYVNCCFCKENINIQDCFLYCKNIEECYSNEKVCLDCSLKIKDWRCLRDWEDTADPKNAKMCSRCKKMKNRNRFKPGNKGCSYCSLKRKRLYLLQKI